MDISKFDKILFSRKFQIILFALCLAGILDAANSGLSYNLYVFLLGMGLISSVFTIIVKTIMTKDK